MKSLKIAILSRFRVSSADGIDRTVTGHVSQLTRRGHRVTILSHDLPGESDLRLMKSMKVEILQLPYSYLGKVKYMLTLRGRFDLICLHSVFRIENWIAVAAMNCHWMTTPNGGYSPGQISYKRNRSKRAAIWLYERHVLTKALCVHVLSSTEAEQVRRLAPQANTIIAPNGINPHDDVARSDLQRIKGTRFLFVGRLAWMHKGLDLLLDGISKMKSEKAYHFDLVGPGKPDQVKYLKNLVSKFQIDDKVSFTGMLQGQEKKSILERSHVFVHTSRWEGMPFAVLEALQAGMPVVVTDGTNMTDLIAEYDAGWVADYGEIERVLEAIVEAPDDELKRKGENASRLAAERLNWDSIGDHLFGEIEKLLTK